MLGVEIEFGNNQTPLETSSYSLISHWGRKHANAAYIPYEKREPGNIEYRYLSPASLGVGTDFTKYLNAMQAGMVVYDPGPKLTDASTDRSRVKARSQFRISVKNLSILYEKFEDVAL
ncbi:MAG: MvaI/BcnI family restriction endonuclease [Alcaligenaceae bacterium]